MSSKQLAVIYIVLNIAFMHLQDVLIKLFASNIPLFQGLFLRFFSEFILAWIFLDFSKIDARKNFELFNPLILLRSSAIVAATVFWYLGIPGTPIAEVTTFAFLIPIVTLIAAVIFLREKASFTTWLSNLLGFIGVGVIINFDFNSLLYNASGYLILGVIFFSIFGVVSKKIVDILPLNYMIFYTSMLCSILCLPLAIYQWKAIELTNYIVFFAIGILSFLAGIYLIRAYKLESVSFLTPFMYIELIFACMSNFFLFGDHVTKALIIGAFVIILANIITCLPGNMFLNIRLDTKV